MAKYEDYVKQVESTSPDASGLDAEIHSAADAQVARETDTAPTEAFVMPDRFKGQTKEQIVTQFQELQAFSGRQANDLGGMRALVDSMATETDTSNEEASQPITSDDLYEDPAKAVAKAVEAHPAIREAKALKDELAKDRVLKAQEDFLTKHPTFHSTVQSPEFQNWVAADPFRINLFRQADAYDFGAAETILKLYQSDRGVVTPAPEVTKETTELMQNVALETPGTRETAPARVFSRQKWLGIMTRAKQGDLQADEYIRANSPAYRKALESGNVRD